MKFPNRLHILLYLSTRVEKHKTLERKIEIQLFKIIFFMPSLQRLQDWKLETCWLALSVWRLIVMSHLWKKLSNINFYLSCARKTGINISHVQQRKNWETFSPYFILLFCFYFEIIICWSGTSYYMSRLLKFLTHLNLILIESFPTKLDINLIYHIQSFCFFRFRWHLY